MLSSQRILFSSKGRDGREARLTISSNRWFEKLFSVALHAYNYLQGNWAREHIKSKMLELKSTNKPKQRFNVGNSSD